MVAYGVILKVILDVVSIPICWSMHNYYNQMPIIFGKYNLVIASTLVLVTPTMVE